MGSSVSVNHANFATEVIQKSYEKPVLVDFFATWCGPCQMLKPMLEKLVQEYDFVLAKVDIDQNPELANNYRVEGVPDVRVVVDGQVSEGFVGVLSEPQLRQFLAQLNLKSTLDDALETIYTEASRGHVETAQAKLEELLQQYPGDRKLLLEAANFYIETDQFEMAEKLLSSIPEHDKAYFPHAKSLKALILLKQIASQPETGNELDQQFQQAARFVLEENYEAGLNELLTIVSRDRHYKNDGARKAMLAVFDLLGDDHPLTRDYRKRLTMTLY
ncbi:tetratricopeptide repeat protein [Leptothermofonsia sp. ETS-13]|uniref:tetratricopeptide repeat protein n=1 Tax=Leptothermofonsia sp. ETS-13 TaxID=3035696 RepID=UPI003B9EA664